jgi:hypothetical protein
VEESTLEAKVLLSHARSRKVLGGLGDISIELKGDA